MSKASIVTDATFDTEVLQSSKPVLVDVLGRVVRAVQDGRARARGDRLRVRGPADAREGQRRREPRRRSSLRRHEHPTLALFQDGEEKKRLVGAMPKRSILAEIADYV